MAGYADHSDAGNVRLKPGARVELTFVPSLRGGAEDTRQNRNQTFSIFVSPATDGMNSPEAVITEARLDANFNRPGDTLATEFVVPASEGVYLLAFYHLSTLLGGGQMTQAFQGFVTVDANANHAEVEGTDGMTISKPPEGVF